MLGVYWCSGIRISYSGIRISYSESGCFTPQAGVLAMWPWYTTAAPTYALNKLLINLFLIPS